MYSPRPRWALVLLFAFCMGLLSSRPTDAGPSTCTARVSGQTFVIGESQDRPGEIEVVRTGFISTPEHFTFSTSGEASNPACAVFQDHLVVAFNTRYGRDRHVVNVVLLDVTQVEADLPPFRQLPPGCPPVCPGRFVALPFSPPTAEGGAKPRLVVNGGELLVLWEENKRTYTASFSFESGWSRITRRDENPDILREERESIR